MENTFKPCSGTHKGNHEGEYGVIGFSPCAEYVAHEINVVCDVIDNPPTLNVDNTPCTCRSEVCPCGDFVSHKISEPCTGQA